MSETNPGLLLFVIVALILLFVGIIAWVITYVGRSRDKSRTPVRADQNTARPAPRTPVAGPVVDPPGPAPEPQPEAPAHPGEVMRVIRDEQTGRVLVHVEGKQYAHIREITDARVGRRVLWAIADLVRFTGGMATNPQAVRSVLDAAPPPQEQPATAAVTSPPPPPPSVQVAPPTSAAPRAVAPTMSTPARPSTRSYESSPPETQGTRKRYNLVDYFRQGFQARASAEPIPGPTSFIDEIEEILQGYLQALPTPLPFEVHMLSSETGLLQIEVGNDTYSSPDEVPDPQIQQLIRAAVAEWEKR